MLPEEIVNVTAADYVKYFKESRVDSELVHVTESTDDMFTRLEELENMIAIVQEERGNAVGMTGALTLVMDHKQELTKLFQRIDALEQVVEHSKRSIDSLEHKVDAAEQKFGLSDTSSKLLKMFANTLFKKSNEEGTHSSQDLGEFCVDDYFSPNQTTG